MPRVYSFSVIVVLVTVLAGIALCLFFQLTAGDWAIGLAPTVLVCILMCLMALTKDRIVVLFRPWSLEQGTKESVPVVHYRWRLKTFSAYAPPYLLARARIFSLSVPVKEVVGCTFCFDAQTPRGVDSLYRLSARGVEKWVELWSSPKPADPAKIHEWVSEFERRLESSLNNGGYPGIRVRFINPLRLLTVNF